MNKKIVQTIIFLLLLGTSYSLCHAEIYAYIDKNGQLMISKDKTDQRFVRFDPQRPVTQFKIATKESVSIAPSNSGKAQLYAPLIATIANEVGISQHLLHAVIQVESAYDPVAVSPKGAQGLMQLIPETAERFGVTKVTDPAANIRGGARYLKLLLNQFDQNLTLALAAYNAGAGTVRRYNNSIPPYPETQSYVERVVALFEERKLRLG